jgi:hypothetical protein
MPSIQDSKEIPVKKIVLSALALAAAAGVANAQTLEYRIVERFNDTVVDQADAAPTASAGTVGTAADKTLWFVVQARVTGLAGGAGDFTVHGLGGFAGAVNITTGGGGGSFKATGTAGTGGNPTNNSPSNFYPASGAPNPGFGTGAALYSPFRLVSDLGAGGNGTRASVAANALTDIVGATGGAALANLTDGIFDNSNWGVNTWVNVYTFQYDVTAFNARTVTFQTSFVGSTFFNAVDGSGVPNAIPFQGESQGSYTVTITPAPGAAALLGLGGLLAARRRRA